MKNTWRLQLSRINRRSGLSLVEVMVAMVILTFMAASLVTAYIQNARMARAIALRTMATTTAIGIAEQMRSWEYAQIRTVASNPTKESVVVRVFDPADATNEAGMREVELVLNTVDGTEVNSAWTEVSVPFALNEDQSAVQIPVPMRFWVDCTNRVPKMIKDDAGTPVVVSRCQVYELALVYQWTNPNVDPDRWQSGVIRMVTPNMDMNTEETVVPLK